MEEVSRNFIIFLLTVFYTNIFFQTVIAARIPSAVQFPLTVIFNFVTVPYVEDFASNVLTMAWKKYTSNLPSIDEETFEDDDTQDDEIGAA